MKVKVSDFIANRVAEAGIRQVFMITGGGAMHLNDSFGKHPQLHCVFNHHEQASAMAAESYARLSGQMALVNVTTGPGGINAMNGVFGAYTDSVPMLVISGQVRYDTTVRSSHLPLRQLGDQEYDIIKSVAPMTKYAVMVTEPNEIAYHLDRAIFLAQHGRPGPTWLDIPMNVQGAYIQLEDLKPYEPSEDELNTLTGKELATACEQILTRLKQSKRPVILAGTGVRTAQAVELLTRLIHYWQIPIATAWNAHDLITDDNPFYIGRPGTVGDRAGNFAVQNADFLLILGCRLNIRQISYNWRSFAPHAYQIMVDIDDLELKKPTVKPDLPVHADVAAVVRELLNLSYRSNHEEWLAWCKVRQQKYPVVLSEYWQKTQFNINPYCFTEVLFEQLESNEVIVVANGTASVVTFQAAYIKPLQRLYGNSGCASMGYDLPAAIGAAIARPNQRIICLAGDGSIQMNLQELQTIVNYSLPIKIFILNNQGYHSIRQTQQSYFAGHFIGCDSNSGVTFPNFAKLAYAYNIPYTCCHSHAALQDTIAQVLQTAGAHICEVILDITQPFAPKLASKQLADGTMVSPSLEDMYPFLSSQEIKENTIN